MAAMMMSMDAITSTPAQANDKRHRASGAAPKQRGAGSAKGGNIPTVVRKLPLTSPVEDAIERASQSSARKKPILPSADIFRTTEPEMDESGPGKLLRHGLLDKGTASLMMPPRKNRLVKPSSKRAQALLAAAAGARPREDAAAKAALRRISVQAKDAESSSRGRGGDASTAASAADVAVALEMRVIVAPDPFPLSAELQALQNKFEALDFVLTLSRHIVQRTFAALKVQVEAKTSKTFTLLNLGQIVALVPHMIAVSVSNVGDEPQHVIAAKRVAFDTGGAVVADSGDDGNAVVDTRAQQAVELKPRFEVFKATLVEHVKKHVATTVSALPLQLKTLTMNDVARVPADYDPESLPSIVPFNLPIISDYRSKYSSATLTSKAQTAAAAAAAATTAIAAAAAAVGSISVATSAPLTSTSTALQLLMRRDPNKKKASSSLLDRIRDKEVAKKKALSHRNPNEKLIGQLQQLVRDVLMLVWSKRPKTNRGCASVAYGALCADQTRKVATMSTLEAKTLFELLAKEVGTFCATKSNEEVPWFRIEQVPLRMGDGTTKHAEYAKIESKFEMGPIKRHLLQRSKDLATVAAAV
jgi:hypothetical protein